MQVIAASSSVNSEPALLRGVFELDIANATDIQVDIPVAMQ